jgi:hypothetical protein
VTEVTEEVRRFATRVAGAYAASSVISDAQYGGGREVRLIGPGTVGGDVVPADQVDLVVSFDAPSRTPRWEEHLSYLGRLARKALVVVVRNPDRGWPLRSRGGASMVDLAGVLWKAGRVRERAYLGVPRVVGGPSEGEPSFAPVGLLVRRTARLQAFVVDTTPRTPQARRRLRVSGSP